MSEILNNSILPLFKASHSPTLEACRPKIDSIRKSFVAAISIILLSSCAAPQNTAKLKNTEISTSLQSNNSISPASEAPESKSRILPYSIFKLFHTPLPNIELVSFENYWNYTNRSILSSEDIRYLVGEVVDYKATDELKSPIEVLINGGDCDSLSWLAVTLFEVLGQKIHHDFQARIIGIPEVSHAVTIFFDTDQTWKAIDQGAPIKVISTAPSGQINLADLSLKFQNINDKGDNLSVIQSFSTQKDHIHSRDQTPLPHFQTSLNPQTLQENHQKMIGKIASNIDLTTDLEIYLPNNYNQYEEVHLLFLNGYANFHQGNLSQLGFAPTGPAENPSIEFILIDYDRQLKQITYSDKNPEIKSEILNLTNCEIQKTYHNGQIEWVDLLNLN